MLRLILEIFTGLIKLFQGQATSRQMAQERGVGAALQREGDLQNEENRIRVAGHADLDGLPNRPDPLDRDSPS